MNENVGKVFSIKDDNKPLPGLTISKEVCKGMSYFSLAKNTDISAESFPYHKLIIVSDGRVEIYSLSGESKFLGVDDCILTPINLPVGIRTDSGAVYTEIEIRRNDNMNEKIKAGDVFSLSELVPYQDGKIVNMDVVHNETMKFVVMAFDEGTGLSEHSAPGEALIFALDGEGIIGYEGSEHTIKAGESFHFAKNGLHYVKATKRFKMALLLMLE